MCSQTVWVDGMLLVKFFSADFYCSSTTRELGHWWWQASTDPPCWSRWLLSTSKFETFKLKWMGFCNVGWINPCCPGWPQTTQSYRPRSTIFFSNHISGSGGIQKYYFNAPKNSVFAMIVYSCFCSLSSELNESEFINALLCFIILILHVFKTLEKESLCTNSNRKLESD